MLIRMLKRARQLHLYLGVFFAPAILFFSLTGAAQLFGLHRRQPGVAYQAPKWLEMAASIHKNQTLAQRRGGFPPRERDVSPGNSRPEFTPPANGGAPPQSKLSAALKFFFLAMALGLITTTLLGIYMAFKYNRSRALIWGLLIAGTAIPGLLIALMA